VGNAGKEEDNSYYLKGVSEMDRKQWPHKHMNEKHNGLSSAQEVHYSNDFKKADRAAESAKKGSSR
jgi:hypothetical protein